MRGQWEALRARYAQSKPLADLFVQRLKFLFLEIFPRRSHTAIYKRRRRDGIAVIRHRTTNLRCLGP